MMDRACQPCCHPVTNMNSIDIKALRPWGGVGEWRDVRGRAGVGSKDTTKVIMWHMRAILSLAGLRMPECMHQGAQARFWTFLMVLQ